MVAYAILILASNYYFLIFVTSRFLVPHLGFRPEPLPAVLPLSLLDRITVLKQQAVNKKHFLELAYDYVGNRYKTGRLNTLLRVDYLFLPLTRAWEKCDFLPCTISNYILRIFLIKSGFFEEADIVLRHTFLNNNIHQYLRVRLDDSWLDVDVGEKQRGMPLGQHLWLFG